MAASQTKHRIVESVYFSGLSEEACRLAAMLDEMQDHISKSIKDGIPTEVQRSAQALDCVGQGLSDFSAIFETLSNMSDHLPADTIEKISNSAQQYRVKQPNALDADFESRQKDSIELF